MCAEVAAVITLESVIMRWDAANDCPRSICKDTGAVKLWFCCTCDLLCIEDVEDEDDDDEETFELFPTIVELFEWCKCPWVEELNLSGGIINVDGGCEAGGSQSIACG